MKKCWQCKEFKDESEFRKAKSQHDGLQPTCKACMRAYLKEWRKTPAGKASTARSGKRRRQIQADKVYARALLAEAIKAGKKFREPCEKCGKTPAEGHHDDYNKPLDVRWLCHDCHVAEHHAS